MMSLNEQLISFVFSFAYGIIVSIIYNLSFRYLYYTKEIYKIFNSLLFCLFTAFTYYKVMYLINYGIINIYFILLFLISFIIFNKKFTKIMSRK